jgi:hypothetical protein
MIIFLVGCISETEEFIQGYWYRGDVHFMDQWYFDRGKFSHETGVFTANQNITSGRYQVLDFQDDIVTLELYDLALSFGDERLQIVIKLDWQSGTIRIRSQTYERILP